MLQLIAATLSLLLLAGMFSRVSDTDETDLTGPTEKPVTGSRDHDDSLKRSREDA